MYSVSYKKLKKIKVDGTTIYDFEGFTMPTRSGIKIDNFTVKELKVVDKRLAHNVIIPKVMKKYNKIMNMLTNAIVEDEDPTGSGLAEVLDQTERFKVELKNRYLKYMTRKEMEKIFNTMNLLEVEATNKLINIQNFMSYEHTSSKGR